MSPIQLLVLDWFFNLLHFVIVVSLCTGWIFRRTRFWHRILITGTTFFWILIGPLMGMKIGYCPVTDWGWQIRRARGEKELEYGYINYLLEKVGIFMGDHQTDVAVGIVFGLIWALTLFFWWHDTRRPAR